jgi:GTP-binding protein EngB required for normal cell division
MRAYYINLERRPDRRANMVKQLENLGMEGIYIEAVDGQTWGGGGFKAQGRSSEHRWRGMAGCYFSHRKALLAAISCNVFPCVILEDDCKLQEVPTPEPGMVYLGGFESKAGIYGLHAVMYNTKQDAEDFYNFLKRHKNNGDSVANKYRKLNPDKVKKYSKGFIATQLKDYSDIECATVERTADGKVIFFNSQEQSDHTT